MSNVARFPRKPPRMPNIPKCMYRGEKIPLTSQIIGNIKRPKKRDLTSAEKNILKKWEKHQQDKKQYYVAKKEFNAYQLELNKAARERRAQARHHHRAGNLYHYIRGMIDRGQVDEFSIQMNSRDIGTLIYELSTIHCGWVSVGAAALSKSARTKDHLYGRQFAGETIYRWFIRTPDVTYEDFVAVLDVYRQVAHVTAAENLALVNSQKSINFVCPDHSYKTNGIDFADISEDNLVRLEDVIGDTLHQQFLGTQYKEWTKYKGVDKQLKAA